MKLSLAFVALTAAADSQAPVISLNLAVNHADGYVDANTRGVSRAEYANRHTAAHAIGAKATHGAGADEGKVTTTGTAGAQNSFADECEVPQNTAAGMCQEPVASAYDHHDGDISTSIQTTYTLFVKSLEKKNPVKSEAVKTGINTNIRGEWVITYDVQDVAGNAAEQVQFALIMIDTKAPVFDNSPANVAKTSKCTDKTNCELADGNYIHRDTDASGNHLDIELCGASNTGTQYYIGGPNGATVPSTTGAKLTSTDAYDGSLDQSNSIMSFKIQTVSSASGLAVANPVAILTDDSVAALWNS